MAEINNIYFVHKSILRKSVARILCLCAPQLQLGQLDGWWLESFESLFTNMSGCWCRPLVRTLAGAHSLNTYTGTPRLTLWPEPPPNMGAGLRDKASGSCVAFFGPALEFTRTLFQHTLFIRTNSLNSILLFMWNISKLMDTFENHLSLPNGHYFILFF